jgi:hypothetical protein
MRTNALGRREYTDAEIKQAINLLKSKGDKFFCLFLRSVLFPDEKSINPPSDYAVYVLKSGLVRVDVTTDFGVLNGRIFSEIQRNRLKYLGQLRKIEKRLKE